MATPQQTPSRELNLKQLLTVLDAYRKGDFSARIPNDLLGLPGKVADTLNDIIDRGKPLPSSSEWPSLSASRASWTSASSCPA